MKGSVRRYCGICVPMAAYCDVLEGGCVTQIMIMLPCYLAYAWAAGWFLKKHMDITPFKEFLLVGGNFLIWLVIDIASIFIPYIVLAFIFHVFLMGTVVLFFQAVWEKKILVGAVFVTAVVLITNFCSSLVSCLVLIFMHTVGKIQEPFIDGWEDILCTYVTVLAVIFSLTVLSRHLTAVFYGKTQKWYIIMSVPFLAVVVLTDLVNWGATHGILVRSGGNMGVYYDQIFSHMGICVISGLSMSVAGFCLFGLDRIYLEQRKSSQYYSQIEAYKMLEEQYSRSERLRHDMKNHIIALSGLVKSRDWMGMETYLADMGAGGGLCMAEDTTGNKVIDAVLYQKRERAEENNIQWECDVQIPKSCGINEFDLCVLFGNLIDNALEECGRHRSSGDGFIHIQGGKIKKCFLLVVKNRAEAKDIPCPMQGKNVFAKKDDTENHGIGLMNVRDIVYKYNGEWEIETGKGVFTVSILLPLPDTVQDIKQAL